MDKSGTIFYPEVIPDLPLPQDDTGTSVQTTQQTGNEVFGSPTIQNQDMPTQHIATEVISEALNTRSKKIIQEFQFTPSGALQIGLFEPGVSGDIRISPDGIVARDLAGNTTFALDGDTGDAIFKGTVQAGTFIAGEVVVGNNNLILDGANIRILVNDNSNDRVLIGQF